PISAPGATYASRAAIAPTSERTVQARNALEARRERAANDARLERVSRSVSADATQTHSTYKVVRGDTLSSIAKAHSVEVAQLRAWNQLKSDHLQQGQVLRVSK